MVSLSDSSSRGTPFQCLVLRPVTGWSLTVAIATALGFQPCYCNPLRYVWGTPLHSPAMSVTTERQEEKKPIRRPTVSQVLETIGILSAVGTLTLGYLGTIPSHPQFEVGREVFGNIPTELVVIFYVGVSAFLWLTFHLFAQRAASWEQGQREKRTGQWGERLKRLGDGLRMKTLMRDRRAGVMHSLIYYGFIILFLGTVTLEIDHLMPANLKFLQGVVYQAYSAILDLAPTS